MRGLSERIGSLAYGVLRVGLKSAAAFLAIAPAMADEVTIAALGDSLTQGYGVFPDDGFVPQLDRWLRTRGHDAVVLNAGVSGDTTAGGLARLDWTLTPDVDALIVALGGNDFLRGIDPAVSRANLDAILETATARDIPVLLVGLRAGLNYGPEYRDAFNAMYPELAETYGAIHAPSFFDAFDQTGDRAMVMDEYMQPDGIHPNSEGVAIIVGDLGPYVEILISRVDDP